ncbi:hypothetical protein D3C80_1327060 [compost metagenome]
MQKYGFQIHSIHPLRINAAALDSALLRRHRKAELYKTLEFLYGVTDNIELGLLMAGYMPDMPSFSFRVGNFYSNTVYINPKLHLQHSAAPRYIGPAPFQAERSGGQINNTCVIRTYFRPGGCELQTGMRIRADKPAGAAVKIPLNARVHH